MRAGERPRRGGGARAAMAKQVTETPRPLRALRPDAPARVERVLARALAKNPDERFVTVAEVLAALQGEGADAGSGAIASAGRPSIAGAPVRHASPPARNEELHDVLTDAAIAV